jgi:hypothetical protein
MEQKKAENTQIYNTECLFCYNRAVFRGDGFTEKGAQFGKSFLKY